MRVFFKISGLVQGVGFRWFVRDAAAARGVTGWVANAHDGSVQGQAQGDRKTLDGFLSELKSGRSPGQVTGAETEELEEKAGETGFSIEILD
ncbi:MAG: hypothetical protein A3J79_13805 [Elusimicrobia bacterium RIFOXYB2_FULL_62_6]|nr:MAG: hypothetical protein A3J79_13805 [Elusimicrobia bacterium RIFOXYB2_FULL_62_6]